MAENLYTDILSRFRSYTGQKPEDLDLFIKVWEGRISKLEDLKAKLQTKENDFYASMGIPLTQLNSLIPKVREWNSSNNNFFNPKFQNELILAILYNGFDIKKDWNKEASNVLTEIVNESNVGVEMAKEKVFEYLNNELTKIGETNFSTKGKKGLYNRIIITQENGKLNVSIGDKRLPDTDIKRLEKALSLNRKEASFQKIEEILKQYSLHTYLLEDLRQNFSNFAIYKNYNVIKGFLGELFWSSFARFISNGKLKALPTGTAKEAGSGQSISVDILFNSNGFQIKNFNIKNGHVSFGTRKSVTGLENFIINRLQLPDNDLRKVLLQIFGYYGSFNLSEKASIEECATAIFSGYVDRAIGLDKIFSVSEDIFFGYEQMYTNTFFAIQDRIIPSSKIIEQIIINLRNYLNKEKAKSLFQFSANYSVDGETKDYIYPLNEQQIKEGLRKVKISWEADLNVDEIMSRVINAQTKI